VPGFDLKAYEDGVLKPLRRRMPNLPDDLVARYAVEPGADPGALRERVEAVVRLWTKHAMRQGPMGLLCTQLVREHTEMLARGDDPRSPQFWTRWTGEREHRVGGLIDEVVATLTASFGPVGVLTGGQLRATAAAHGALGDADLDRACAEAGLRVVEPVDLPTTAGMRAPFTSLGEALAAAGVATVPALLHPDVETFGLLGGFTAPGGRALDRAAATARARDLETQRDSPTVRAQKEAVGILVSEADAGTDLATVALFHLLTEVRAQRAEGAQPLALFRSLTRRGLVPEEAALVAVTVGTEGGVAAHDPRSEVDDLLAEGRLVAAERVAAALPAPEGDPAREAVARRRRQVDDLRERARADQRAGRDEEAGTRLREALRLGADVPGLAEQLATVPAAPVLGVTAHPDGVGVRVAWRPAADHGADTTHRVVRGVGRAPVDPADGVEVQGGVDAHAATDDGPPVGRDLHYAVFARSSGGRWSRPACAAVVRVVPPVADVHVEGRPGAVVGRWKVHPDVASVEVRRSEGAPDAPGVPIAVEQGRGFHDTTARDGVQYYYAVVACYPAVDGGPGPRAQPQVHRGATRVAARPVTSLTAVPVTDDGPAVRLSWRQRPGNEIVVRRAGTPCPWEYGATVGRAELDGWGVELDGAFTLRGESATLVAAVPPGRSWCVAFTLGPTGAVRGQDAVVDLTEPVRRLRARRFGDDVLVTWHWPDDVAAADVSWAGGGRRISRQQYRDDGGCRLPGAHAVASVAVSAVLLGGEGDEARAPAVAVEVDQRRPQVHYEVRRRGRSWAGGVRCTVTVTSGEPIADATLVLVGASGHAMPRTPGAGIEILRQPVSITPGVPVELPEVPVPAVLRKPYWLRCFLAEPAPAVLVDPPVSQLKVS
jgi:hypothetical protein